MKSLQSVKEVWNQYRFILTTSQKRWGVVVAFMTLLGAAMETLGVSIIIPLVQAMISPEQLWSNRIIAPVASIFSLTTNKQIIWLVGIAVIIVYILKNLFLFLLSYVRAKYASKVQRELSAEMMRSYLNRGYAFFLDVNTSVILRGMTSSIGNTYNALYQVFRILSEVLTVVCICIFIMLTDLAMSFCVIILALVCLTAVIFGFRRWMKACGDRDYKYSAIINKVLLQAFQGIKEVLVMNKQEYFTKSYEKNFIKRQKATIGQIVATESPAFLIEAVCVAGLIIAVCVKALSSPDTGAMVPQLAAFAVGAFRILPSLGRISSSFNQFIFCLPGLHETYDNFKEVRSVENIKFGQLSKQSLNEGFKNDLTIKDITWNYKESVNPVLKDLNMKIEKGESIAFVGSSGAGKTTLADVILGLLYPQAGKVLIDGINIHEIPEQWSRIIGFVPQAVYLTDDTIRSNIGFGLDEDEIEDAMVWSALEQAQMKSFIEELPNGLNTVIGERGVRFSGGQRQRIAIARALYQNPDILVLDEATSALDNETEAAVMEAIEKLQGHKTLIIIAHRLTTVAKCDKIYVIENGKAMIRNKDKILKTT